MNREILFRGKRLDNGEWIEGAYVPPCVLAHGAVILANSGHQYGIDPDTVGELSATNGDEKLFEGDIIEFAVFDHEGIDHWYRGVIKWANWGWEIWKTPESGFGEDEGVFYISEPDSETITIVGNIYDNPELIGGTPDEASLS